MQEFKEAVVTLYEKNYYIGVAALLNSLYKSNFEGLAYVGFRDNLPPWVNQLDYNSEYYSIGLFKVKFIKVSIPTHLGYYKPFFLKETLETYKSLERIFYFDPDIVINAPWSFISNWTNSGVSLCLDNCFPFVHHNHPWREEWKKLFSLEYNNNALKVNFYVNSGFIGLNRTNCILLDRWIEITNIYKSTGGDLTLFEKDGFRCFKGDQDLLNAAITVSSDLIFSIIGTEGMGFTQPSYLMSHATGSIKPWNKKYTKWIIKYGQKPNNSERDFFSFCEYPISAFKKYQLVIKRIDLKIAASLGRFMG